VSRQSNYHLIYNLLAGQVLWSCDHVRNFPGGNFFHVDLDLLHPVRMAQYFLQAICVICYYLSHKEGTQEERAVLGLMGRNNLKLLFSASS